MTAKRFDHRISTKNEESYYTYVDLTGLNFEIRITSGTLLKEGDNFEYGQGAAIYSGQWGSIQHFDITVEKLDRENKLVSYSFRVQSTSLNTGETYNNFEGFLNNLPLTAEPNP